MNNHPLGDGGYNRKNLLAERALGDLENNKPIPKCFFRGKPEPKGLSDVWGSTQLKGEEVAVAGLAPSFYNLIPSDKANLISIREI